MTRINDDDDHNIARRFLGFFLVLGLVPIVWLFWGFNQTFRQCVTLKNGLNLGYEAVFDLSRPYFRPLAVPRFADGTPLVRDDLWALFISDTTAHGVSLSDGNDDYRFAWRADSGLILERDDPTRYQRLVAEAGPANWDLGTGHFGTGWLLSELQKRPAFGHHWCQTSLITW